MNKMSFKEWAELNGYRTDGKHYALRAGGYAEYLASHEESKPIDYSKGWEFERIQCCDDCVLYIANGDVPHDDDTFQERFDKYSGGPQVKRMVFEHEHVVDWWVDLYIRIDDEGSTETNEFSHQRCETCNGLAGRRTTVDARIWGD